MELEFLVPVVVLTRRRRSRDNQREEPNSLTLIMRLRQCRPRRQSRREDRGRRAPHFLGARPRRTGEEVEWRR